MTDLEMTKACAEAMGYRVSDDSKFDESGLWCHLPAQHGEWYRPLSGDTYGNAQAMMLVKTFDLRIIRIKGDINDWNVSAGMNAVFNNPGMNADLNRAIVECVAKMKERP